MGRNESQSNLSVFKTTQILDEIERRISAPIGYCPLLTFIHLGFSCQQELDHRFSIPGKPIWGYPFYF